MQTMTIRYSIPVIISLLLIFISCSGQEAEKKNSETVMEEVESVVKVKEEPHRYGGWYCPDNFGFTPVDIEKLSDVPAIADRLPTEAELNDNMSLIKVDVEKYPDAKALEMDLPRVASVYSENNGMSELVIIIQAIVVQKDTIVGYRFANGGNGSARMSDVNILSENEVAMMGSLPFFYSKSNLNASSKEIWSTITKTDYFKQLGEKFDKKEFFSSGLNSDAQAHLNLDIDGEKATGFVGMVFGNFYLHIDYDRDGFHYSEKLLMIENQKDNSTEFFFASGPYPDDFEKQKSNWDNWVKTISKNSEAK